MKKQDKTYRPDAENGLDIDDEGNTGTKRNFKVISADDSGPVKGDPPVVVKAQPAKAPPSPAGGLAGTVGMAAMVRPKAAGPMLYRWAPGQSLVRLTPLSAEEARRVLARSAAIGPVGAAAASAPSSDDPLPPRGN